MSMLQEQRGPRMPLGYGIIPHSEPAGDVPLLVKVPLMGMRLPDGRTRACLAWLKASGVARKQSSVMPAREAPVVSLFLHSRYESDEVHGAGRVSSGAVIADEARGQTEGWGAGFWRDRDRDSERARERLRRAHAHPPPWLLRICHVTSASEPAFQTGAS
jgi:hypothetical protein